MRSTQLFVPGRVCVLGEHTDWAGGHRVTNPAIHRGQCLVFGTDVGIYATATAAPSTAVGAGRLTFREPSTPEAAGQVLDVPWDAAELKRLAAEGGFFSYVCGTAAATLERLGALAAAVSAHDVAFEVTKMTLPMGKGLSSSAAVCVLVARGLGLLFRPAAAPFTVEEEMDLAYHGERLTKSMCGRMDQCCAYGSKFVAMIFDGEGVATEPVACPSVLHFVVADLNASKDTPIILARLGEAFPHASTPLHERVQEFLGPVSWGFAEAAKAAIAAGDAPALGAILTETQRVFDECLMPACPEQLTSPRLHHVLAHPDVTRHTLGGKGVGSQGDGSVQFVCRDAESQRATIAALEGLGCHAFALSVGGARDE
jgi:galactokinase